jgi:hypothetical protein
MASYTASSTGTLMVLAAWNQRVGLIDHVVWCSKS